MALLHGGESCCWQGEEYCWLESKDVYVYTPAVGEERILCDKETKNERES